MHDEPDGTPSRCRICGAEWDMDYDPVACTCDDGGSWEIKVEGEWRGQSRYC